MLSSTSVFGVGAGAEHVMLKRDNEDGVVVVWMALLIFVLLGFAAIAIDVTIWQGSSTTVSSAPPTPPRSRCGPVSARSDDVERRGAGCRRDQRLHGQRGHGVRPQRWVFTAEWANDADVRRRRVRAQRVQSQDRPPRQQHVRRRAGHEVGGVIGATASATYLKPLSMGSPSNQFGNDPDAIRSWPVSNPPPQTYPNFWGNIVGRKFEQAEG